MERKKWASVCVFVAVVAFCVAPMARADELGLIRAAIAAKGAKWVAGETSMSRLTQEERRMHRGALPAFIREGDRLVARPDTRAAAALPSSLDWRNLNGGNYVTGIKYQGFCGGCWAFSTTAALESLVLKVNKTPGVDLDLSEQTLIDCVDSSNNSCRSGGSISQASAYAQTTGLPVESCYPFQGIDLWSCAPCAGWQQATYKIAKWRWVANSYSKLPPTVNALRSALNAYGPVVTTMVAFPELDHYVSGIYEHVRAAEDDGSLHAVLIVGYNDSEQYFIVKNSWGAWWGESGFFRISYSQLSNDVLFGGQTIAYEPLVPKISVTPGSLNFGAVKTGSPSIAKPVTVKNSGTGNLSVGSLSLTGVNSSEFTQSNDCGVPVGPGLSCTVTVAALPDAPYGNKSAKLAIPSNDSTKPVSMVSLAANASPPKITVSPASLGFGAVTGSKMIVLSIKNTGVSDLTIGPVVKTGNNPSYFAISGACSVVSAKDKCDLQITFTPDSKTARTARIEIPSDDPALKGRSVLVNLTGKGK
jgi:C1A family cysteine protease